MPGVAGFSDDPGRRADVEVWAYDAATVVLRQSIRTHFEAPFMYLLVGRERALLVDTGTGDADVRGAVDHVLAALGHDVELVVAHTHGHSDHVGGDASFSSRPRTTVVGHRLEAVEETFSMSLGQGAIDLGARVVEVLAVPGHEPSHVAFYDRTAGLLLTGDVLYPGRLYVREWDVYRESIARLVRFVDDARPVRHVVGSHVELTEAGEELMAGASSHPDERFHALGEHHLRELASRLARLEEPVRMAARDFVIVPVD